MSPADIAEWAIIIGRVVLSTAINWFQEILIACGTFDIWKGVIVFVALFSIILIPLRGGGDLTAGLLGGFVMNRINKRKPTDSDD